MPMLGGWATCRAVAVDMSRPEMLRWADDDGPLTISFVGDVSSGHYRLRLGRDLAVDVLPDQLATWQRSATDDCSLDHFLSDQVIPRVLAHRGDHVVHAGAVRSGDSAILMVGPSGRGKSTLAASFDQAGEPLLGDDAMVIGWQADRPFATPVYPSLRLLPDSIAAILPPSAATDEVAHYTSKRRVRLPIDDSGPAVAVTAIMVIGEPAEAIETRRLSAADACIALVTNSFALDPSDVAQAQRRLEASCRLAASVPTFEIRYPRDYAQLPMVRAAILDLVAG